MKSVKEKVIYCIKQGTIFTGELKDDMLLEDKTINMDELDLVELTMQLEEEFEIEILDEDAEKFKSVGDIMNYMKNKEA